MGTWICKVCGYAHEGAEAPDRCPQCGVTSEQFYRQGSGHGWSFGIVFLILIIAATVFAFMSCRHVLTVDNSPVEYVDLNRYLGKWYEIARLDHRFERDMEQCTAIYAMRNDGKISVTNQGRKHGVWKTSTGKAKLTDHSGIFRVSFFGPFYSDYRVLMLAPDYSYALVGGSTNDYLWILSRTPMLHEKVRDTIVDEARNRGYPIQNLIWVRQ